MKSELRHKLQRNALADWLVETGQTLKPYQNLLTIVAIGVLAVIVAYTWWSHASAEQAAQAWNQVYSALNQPDALARVANDNRDSPAGQMAAVLAADSYLAEGCELLFQDKARANDALKNAISMYQSPQLNQTHSPMLQERACFGLARAMECKGEADDLKEASRLYQEVATKWPHGAYVAEAKQRIGDLKNRETKLMYDDFAKFNPTPAAPETGEPGAKPPAFDLPSDRPKNLGDIDYERKFDGAEQPSPSKAAPEKGASDKGPKEPGKAAPKQTGPAPEKSKK